MSGQSRLYDIDPFTKLCLLAGTPAFESLTSNPATANDASLVIAEGLSDTASRLMADERWSGLLPEGEKALVTNLSLVQARASLVAMSEARPILQDLQLAGVDHSVVKGAASARFYPPSWPRNYTDVDIVVEPRSFGRSMNIAGRNGWSIPLTNRPQWHSFCRLCREGINLHNRQLGNLDVHHHVPPWVFGRKLSTNEIIARSEVLGIDGVIGRFATRRDLMVISALHVLNDAWKGKLGLQALRDFLVLAQPNIERQQEVFEAVGLTWLFEMLHELLATLFPQMGIRHRHRLAKTGVANNLRLWILGWTSEARVAKTDLAWAARLPLPNAGVFLAGSLLPSPQYVREHDRRYTEYWRRTLLQLLSQYRGGPPLRSFERVS